MKTTVTIISLLYDTEHNMYECISSRWCCLKYPDEARWDSLLMIPSINACPVIVV